MAGEHRLGRRRAKPDGAEGRHPADEAIHQHGHALQRTAQKDAAETRDVKPAKLGEDIQRVVRVGLIDRNAPLNGVDLPGKADVYKRQVPARRLPGAPRPGPERKHLHAAEHPGDAYKRQGGASAGTGISAWGAARPFQRADALCRAGPPLSLIHISSSVWPR